MGSMTTKDKNGRILVEGQFKICNASERCSGNHCYESCIINRMIARLYELEHKES